MPFVSLTANEIALALEAVRKLEHEAEKSEQTPKLAGIASLKESLRDAMTPLSDRDEKIVSVARSMSYVSDGEVEIDDQAEGRATIVSEGDDNGAYVLGWVWADFAGTELDKDKEDGDEEDEEEEGQDGASRQNCATVTEN